MALPDELSAANIAILVPKSATEAGRMELARVAAMPPSRILRFCTRGCGGPAANARSRERLDKVRENRFDSIGEHFPLSIVPPTRLDQTNPDESMSVEPLITRRSLSRDVYHLLVAETEAYPVNCNLQVQFACENVNANAWPRWSCHA